MVGFVFGGFGAFLRWIFVFKCNSNKMGKAYNAEPVLEGSKNRMAGFVLVPIAIIIGLLFKYS